MAYGNSKPGGGEADMYSDTPESGSPAPKGGEEKKSDEQTALISKSVLGGKDFKPGEEVVLEIVEVRDDDVVVKYASEEKGEDETKEGEKPPAQVPADDAEMSSMME